MLSTIQPKLGALAAFQAKSTVGTANSGQFGSILASTTTSSAPNATAGAGVSISAAAQQAASKTFDFDFSVNNVNHTQAEMEAYYKSGADRVSAMQGLPAGQYDFTNMSPKQMQVVTSSLVFERKISVTDLVGFPANNPDSVDRSGGGYNPSFSDQSRNWVEQGKTELAFNTSGGYEQAAFLGARALDIMSQLLTTAKPDLTELPEWAKPQPASS